MTSASDGAGASLARRAVAVAGTRVTLLVLGTAASVVIARTLGPDGRGEYAFVVTLALTAVTLAHASVEQSQVFLVSTGVALRRLAANAVWLGAALGSAAVVVVLLLCLLVGYPDPEPFAEPALVLALLSVPFAVTSLYANGLLVLEGRTDLLNRGGLLGGLSQLAALGALALWDRLTVTTVVAAWAVSAALPLLVSLGHLRPRPGEWSSRLAREEVTRGLRYHVGLSSLYLLLRVDVLLLAAMRSDAEVGLYALAVTLIELTNVATDAVATVVVKRQVTSDLEESARLTARTTRLTTALALVAVLGMCLAGPLLVPFVYGSAFAGSVPALLALAPGVLALAATRTLGGYLIRLDRPWVSSGLTVAALVLNVALNLVLIPPLGIVGAGAASSVAYALLAGAYAVWFARRTGLPVRRLLLPARA